MKKLIISGLLTLCGFYLSSQEYNIVDSIQIDWYSMEEAKTAFDESPRPILLFFYDLANDSSVVMLDSTWRDKDVTFYINNYFYPVKIDVKSKTPMTFFNGETFTPIPGNAYHPLVNRLLGDNPQVPATIVFNRQGEGMQHTGFFNRTHIFPIILFHGEEADRQVEFEDYLKYFRKVYPAESGSGYTMVRSVVKWLSLEDAIAKNAENPRLILLDYYLNERNSSTIMYLTSYNNATIGNYINQNYYPVHFNATSKDTINAFGATYTNPGTTHPFHELPVAMLAGNMHFPSLLILDEENKLLERIQAYLTPEKLESILHFYGSGAYKKQNYTEFLKNFDSKLPEEKSE